MRHHIRLAAIAIASGVIGLGTGASASAQERMGPIAKNQLTAEQAKALAEFTAARGRPALGTCCCAARKS